MVGVTRRHNLAVRLQHHAIGYVARGVEFGGDLAVAAEAGVQAAVGVVPRQSKVSTGGDLVGIARRHDLAVRLHGNAKGVVVGGAEVGCGLAADTETKVKGAGGRYASFL